MSRRERIILIVLGVVAAGAAAFFLLTQIGGEEPVETAAPAPQPSPPLPAAPGTGVGEPEEEPEVPRAITFFGGRDPFVPLVVAETEATGAETAPATTEGAAEVPPGEEPVQPAPPGAEQEQEGAEVAVEPKSVTLIGVTGSTAQVSLDGRNYRVAEGQEFARYYALSSIEGRCGRFLYGDESFILCAGGAPK